MCLLSWPLVLLPGGEKVTAASHLCAVLHVSLNCLASIVNIIYYNLVAIFLRDRLSQHSLEKQRIIGF